MFKCSRAIGILLSTPSNGSFGSYWSNYAFCVCVFVRFYGLFILMLERCMIDVCANVFEFWPFKNFIMLLQGDVRNLVGEGFTKLLITFIMNLHQHLFVSLSIVFFNFILTLFQHKSPSWIKSNLTKVKQILNL